jgi:deoxyribonuclease-4
MSAKLLGAHIKINQGLGTSLRNGKAIGCNAVQVFTSSPQQWYAKPITNEQVADFKDAQTETGITEVVSHDSYLVNLCAPEEEIAQKSYDGLKNEMFRCGLYGIKFVVSHMGSCKGQPEAESLLKVANATMRLLDETPEEVTLLMETTAGQGSALNWRFEQLAMLLELCKGHPRLCVCLDTCHIFAAGYDIRTPETYEMTFEGFDHLVGLDRLKVIHCNDSKRELGSRIDRHDHIGKGMIGDEAFRLLVTDKRFENTPILLETEASGHAEDLAHLRELATKEAASSR